MTILLYIDPSFDKSVDSAQFLRNMFYDSSLLLAWCEIECISFGSRSLMIASFFISTPFFHLRGSIYTYLIFRTFFLCRREFLYYFVS